MLLDSAHSTPAKSIQSARNHQPGRFLFDSMSRPGSLRGKPGAEGLFLEEKKEAIMPLGGSGEAGWLRQ